MNENMFILSYLKLMEFLLICSNFSVYAIEKRNNVDVKYLNDCATENDKNNMPVI